MCGDGEALRRRSASGCCLSSSSVDVWLDLFGGGASVMTRCSVVVVVGAVVDRCSDPLFGSGQLVLLLLGLWWWSGPGFLGLGLDLVLYFVLLFIFVARAACGSRDFS